MLASIRALLEGIIDYAGLFPPQLPLDQAFRNYLRYRQEPENWMLGRFIIPATNLDKLHPNTHGLRLSVLVRGGNTCKEFSDAVNNDLELIKKFRAAHKDAVTVDVIEIKLPTSLIREHADGTIIGAASCADGLKLNTFYEPDLSGDYRSSVNGMLPVIARSPIEHTFSAGTGLKLRCGGLEASAFPSSEQVAFVLTACRDALVPLKFTAGLHHPIRHYNEGVKTKMHGFLNVFGAGVLAHRHQLTESQVKQIIEDEDPSHFVFEEDGFGWKDYRASVGEIRLSRQLAATSFGSCSFDEPRDDLRQLGLL